MFRSQFSETIFNQKYAHEGCETWGDLARTLVLDVGKDLLSKSESEQLINYITDLKFIPGGRYLYYAGRPNKFFNNCFGRGTKVLTDAGWRNVEDLGEANIFSPVDATYKKAEFKKHGIQSLNEITFAPIRGKSKIEYKVKATENHRWLLLDGSETTELRVGDKVPANEFGLDSSDLGFAHGFVFGDGNANGQLRLCSSKDLLHLPRLQKVAHSVTHPEFSNGDSLLYFNNKVNWKSLPEKGASPEYIASFIEGWLAADSCHDRILHCVNKNNLEWFREHAAFAGLVVTGVIRSQTRDVTIGNYEYKNHEIFMISYQRGSLWNGFKVKSIEAVGEEEVFCPFEPEYNQIVIDHNIHTYQCFIFISEEDTREDWANLSWKTESSLMTGGGIGNDYSVYRPEGTRLGGTGGTASGPIPKMQMIDEIGTRVMQGGSRRSAIYASLNWKHGDINTFLKCKNWHEMEVAGTGGLTVADLKKADFNYKAPLDMTNISVNYDTEWLLNYWDTGEVGDVFKENCKQALSTAEPGFSFNFFDKEKETGRNACTEVTSSDDSDVCNLGSVNLGRIDDIRELADVVDLATKFLICGTLKAKLPFKKVEEVREKNRRLGLGLMGIHEWLIKKGYSYEVTPELHQWLSVYKAISDKTSREFADKQGVSRPVANRAIAPTGSIGILAGTSTGIEPIFAVAYKRRYLKGKSWHYQYVVDSAAKELIDLYGANPDNIESALDLSVDFERRVKFQADIQDYVDMAISSTINLPQWGSKFNNEDKVEEFSQTLAKYAHRLRGFTAYPDGARGGQPLTSVPYGEALEKLGEEFEESVETHDICDISSKGGSCGV
jgi:ribonucleoside-diphosphate reductase alpha chain